MHHYSTDVLLEVAKQIGYTDRFTPNKFKIIERFMMRYINRWSINEREV